ncbi:MAG: ATP-dependent Clp protease adaptor ClpS [Bacteroidales bacterium]|nr:ATP-dependent Clp protease adaptor ClpS [Bacteroidales bacterium]MBR5776853.1 ATP-dependent Clp protease adaptor ClpS [Bacteroidales bacterium]
MSKKKRKFAHSNTLKMEQEKYSEEICQDVDLLEDDGCKLVLYNDDYHTFDYVILALERVCGHTAMQAEQCTLLVHYNGKCVVKTGGYDDLLPLHTALLDRQLTSEILR